MKDELVSQLLEIENSQPMIYDKPLYKFYKLYDERRTIDEQEDEYYVAKKDGEGYYLINKYFASVLAENAIWFSPPDRFNDPWDAGNSITIVQEIDDENHKGLLIDLKNHYKRTKGEEVSDRDDRSLLQDALLEYFKTFRVTCFTKTFDNRPMWASYGDNHRGICLGFQFLKMNENGYNTFDPKYSRGYEVKYSEDFATIKDISNLRDITACLLQSKHPDWAYEKEVRFIKIANNEASDEGGVVPFNKRSLTRVVFGCRVPMEVIDYITSMLITFDYTDLDMYRLIFNPKNKGFEGQKRRISKSKTA